MSKMVEDLHMLLMLLTSWEEDSTKNPGTTVKRAWKGFEFDILNSLESDKFIYQLPKSVVLTAKGIEKAQKFQNQYFTD